MDILARYRRPGTVPAAMPETDDAPPEANASSSYQAFGISGSAGKPARLDMRGKGDMGVVRPYNAITEINYDQEHYTGILIFFTANIVTITGKNLKPVVDALINGTCEFLAELRDGQEAEPGAPVIEQMLMPQAATSAPRKQAF